MTIQCTSLIVYDMTTKTISLLYAYVWYIYGYVFMWGCQREKSVTCLVTIHTVFETKSFIELGDYGRLCYWSILESACLFPVLLLQMHPTFYVGARNLNTGPHAYISSTPVFTKVISAQLN